MEVVTRNQRKLYERLEELLSNLRLSESVCATLTSPVIKIETSKIPPPGKTVNLKHISPELFSAVEAAEQLATVIRYHDSKLSPQQREIQAVK